MDARIDDRLSVVRVYGPPLAINRPAQRQICIKPYVHRPHTERAGGNLYVDEICLGVENEGRWYDAATDLLDLGALVLTGVSAVETADLARAGAQRLPCAAEGVRAVRCRGGDGVGYVVVANFGPAEAQIDCLAELGLAWAQLSTASARLQRAGESARLTVAAGTTAVLRAAR